jgi:biopolymer transport protein ExbD
MSPSRPAAPPEPDPRGKKRPTVGGQPLVARRPLVDDAHFDVTAMVDLVFMMNIFFLVTWASANMAELDLPTARHCTAVDPDTTVIIAVTGKAGQRAEVHLGEAASGEVVADPAEVASKVQTLIEKGASEGKRTVLVKAQKDLKLNQLRTVLTAASSIEGVKLNAAVIERE